ncbi:hypothetical protein BC937DRAFT_88292 [Endogone sp. FLAS-F59071]|nr:hypothetical protein BC937DRAFT_88292 [Endogone sp. FLAS-F59071]|eukprot:RUS18831.1 hypothetical protein BC937DRAFT_88292 [Endogone sp. FLAS-F59071]
MSTRQSRRLSTQTNLSTRPKRRLSTQTNVSTRPPLKRSATLSTRRNTLAPPPAPPAPSTNNKCSLVDVLTLGRETGAYIEPEAWERNQESQLAPDERLTSLLGDMLRLQDELYEFMNEKYRLADGLSSFDVVRSREIDAKTARLQTLASHLDHLLTDQRSLLVRLKQPYAGECVRVEPEFHRHDKYVLFNY